MRRRWLAIAALAAAFDASAAEGLRTLFHSASERDQLDRQRRGEPPEAQSPATPRAPPAVTGFVKRSDGRDTVWLDGKATTGPEAQRLADPAKMRESSRAAHPSIDIKTSR
jgi:hypothetical protein